MQPPKFMILWFCLLILLIEGCRLYGLVGKAPHSTSIFRIWRGSINEIKMKGTPCSWNLQNWKCEIAAWCPSSGLISYPGDALYSLGSSRPSTSAPRLPPSLLASRIRLLRPSRATASQIDVCLWCANVPIPANCNQIDFCLWCTTVPVQLVAVKLTLFVVRTCAHTASCTRSCTLVLSREAQSPRCHQLQLCGKWPGQQSSAGTLVITCSSRVNMSV